MGYVPPLFLPRTIRTLSARAFFTTYGLPRPRSSRAWQDTMLVLLERHARVSAESEHANRMEREGDLAMYVASRWAGTHHGKLIAAHLGFTNEELRELRYAT